MKKASNLSWPDRLALVNAHTPTDTKACEVLGVSNDELRTARELEKAGSIIASTDLDTDTYASLFEDSIKNPRTKPSQQSITRGDAGSQRPLSATKVVREPKKRGRKGDNIAKAFAAIPTTPTNVETFAAAHGVSVAVLRQSKRFDTTGTGTVTVKKDKDSGELRICRVVAKTDG